MVMGRVLASPTYLCKIRAQKTTGCRTTLICDENSISARLLSFILKGMNMEVSIAGNGEEATNMVQIRCYDFVFIDFSRCADETEDILRAVLPLSNRTILVGMSADPQVPEEFINAMDCFLPKPFTKSTLDALLHYETKGPATLADSTSRLTENGISIMQVE
eukprot:Clim_evm16s15 gene=Clim_evmTU16s15